MSGVFYSTRHRITPALHHAAGVIQLVQTILKQLEVALRQLTKLNNPSITAEAENSLAITIGHKC